MLLIKSGLYFVDEPSIEQPGTYVRRYTGKHMNDDELRDHFMALARENGGTIKAQYINGISLVIDKDHIYEYQGDAISYEPFFLTDQAHSDFEPGFPLDSISKDIKSGKYFYDIKEHTDDSKKRVKAIQDFFKKHLE